MYALADNLLQLVPEPIDLDSKLGVGDGSALFTVLTQEMQRYNGLLSTIRKWATSRRSRSCPSTRTPT